MGKRWLAVLALAGCFALATPAALADRPQGKGKGNPHAGNSHGQNFDRGDHDWERRGDYEYRVYDHGSVPPGWGHGKKTGWGTDLPPAVAGVIRRAMARDPARRHPSASRLADDLEQAVGRRAV